MMRHISLWSVLAFAFVLAMPVQAQDAQKDLTADEYAEYLQLVEQIDAQGGNAPTGDMIEIADISMSNSKVFSQDERIVTLSFDIVNNGEVQPGLKYAIYLYGKGNKDNGFLIDEQVYDDVVALASGERAEKTITYEIPENFSGTFMLMGSVANDRGLEFGHGTFGDVTVKAKAEDLTIYGKSCALMVNGNEEFDLMQGIDVASDEKIELLCAIENNTDKDVTFTPRVETRLRTIFGDVLSSGKTAQQTIAANTQEFVTLSVPVTADPQSYHARIVLMDGNDTVSNAVSARYVTRGDSATVQNINLDKMSYSTGDTAQLQVFISGRADQFPGSRSSEKVVDQILSFSTEITSGGSACSASQNNIFSQEQMEDGVIDITMSITGDCQNPIVVIAAKNENGKVLDKKDFVLENNDEKNASSTAVGSDSDNKIPTILLVIFALTIIVIVIILIVRYSKRPPLHMFIGLLVIGGGLFVVSDTVSAVTVTGSGRTMTYELKNEIGEVLDPATYDQCEEVYVGASAQRTACGNHAQRLEMYAAIIAPGDSVALSEENVIFRETVDSRGPCELDDDHDGTPNWDDPDWFGGKTYAHEHACMWDEDGPGWVGATTFASSYHTKKIGFVAPGDHVMGFRLWSAQPWGWNGWRTDRVYGPRFGPPVAGTQMCSYCTHDLNYQPIPVGDRDGKSCPCFKGTYDLQKELSFTVIQSSISDKAVTSKDFCAKNPLENGACGLNSTDVPQRWYLDEMDVSEYCSPGTKQDLTNTSTEITWKCMGIGAGSLDSGTCTAPKPIGACGTANIGSFLDGDMPTSVTELCGDDNAATAVITTNPFAATTANWTWDCQHDSGYGVPEPCSANLIPECGIIDGINDSNTYNTDYTKDNLPVDELCASDEKPTNIIDDSVGELSWTCHGADETKVTPSSRDCFVRYACPNDKLQCDKDNKCLDIDALNGTAMLTKDGVSDSQTMSVNIVNGDDPTVCSSSAINCTVKVDTEGFAVDDFTILGDQSSGTYDIDGGELSDYVKADNNATSLTINSVECKTPINKGVSNDQANLVLTCLEATCEGEGENVTCKKTLNPDVSSIDDCVRECTSIGECTSSTGMIKEVQP